MPLDGFWEGTTSAGTRFSFTVRDSKVVDPTVGLPNCIANSLSLAGEFPIKDNVFYAEGLNGKFKLSGTFSGGTATGNADVRVADCVLVGTWSATRR